MNKPISTINPIGQEKPLRRRISSARKVALALALVMAAAVGIGIASTGSDAIAAQSEVALAGIKYPTLRETDQPEMVRYRVAVENAAKRLRDLTFAPVPAPVQF